MPVHHLSSHPDSQSVFSKWVNQHNSLKSRRRIKINQEHIAHKVYHANLNDIFDNNGLKNAQFTSWRYYYIDEAGSHILVEVEHDLSTNKHKFIEAQFGPTSEKHKKLHNDFKITKKLEKEHFESAFLRIYPLKINTIWLKASDFENDLFVPLAPCFHGFKADTIYTYGEFIEIAKFAFSKFTSQNASEDILKGG